MANIIIYGMGVTGEALVRQLQGNNIWWYDDRPQLCSMSLVDIPYDCIDMCIVSPGIQDDSPLLVELYDREIAVIGEWEYCMPLCGDDIVSVTGTNGKTTICQMLHHILTSCNISSALLGNGGVPWCSDIGSGERVTVLESSSFQLARSKGFAPYISVLSNIACDHISYHGSMDSYIEAKCNNFNFQHSGQWAVCNGDDSICRGVICGTNAQVAYYSISDSTANCYIAHGEVVIAMRDDVDRCSMGVLSQYCRHNQSNALCALLVADILGIPLARSLSSLNTYSVDDHKMQLVATIDNVRYINDSKATNISATLSAIGSIDGDIVVLLGGSDKGYLFDSLICNLAHNVVGVVAMGDTASSIADSCVKYGITCMRCDNMHHAVLSGRDMLVGDGTLLLSPACASFDMYANYIERGQDFIAVVGELLC